MARQYSRGDSAAIENCSTALRDNSEVAARWIISITFFFFPIELRPFTSTVLARWKNEVLRATEPGSYISTILYDTESKHLKKSRYIQSKTLPRTTLSKQLLRYFNFHKALSLDYTLFFYKNQ